MFSAILFLALIPSVVFTSNLERRKEIRQGVSVSWLNMRRYSNRILNITAIASFSTTTKEKCGSLCLSTSTCKSLNLKEESPSEYQCELLDQNMFEANCAFLWDEVTSHFAFVVCFKFIFFSIASSILYFSYNMLYICICNLYT